MKRCYPPCPHFNHCCAAVFVTDEDGWLLDPILPCQATAEAEADTPAPPTPIPPAYKDALDVIARHTGLTRAELAAQMQTTDAAARNAIGWLQQHGHIINTGGRRNASYTAVNR